MSKPKLKRLVDGVEGIFSTIQIKENGYTLRIGAYDYSPEEAFRVFGKEQTEKAVKEVFCKLLKG